MANSSEVCPFLYIAIHTDPESYNNSGPYSLGVTGANVSTLDHTKTFLTSVINPALCVFGIIGNCLNVLVLTRKKFQSCLECNHERVAVIGLIMLALSDTLYCISSLPDSASTPRKIFSQQADFLFLYQIYGMGIKAYFTYTSNWLTVLTAVSRYLAICHPLHTRRLIGNKAAYIAVIVICIFWLLFTLPMFWTIKLQRINCPDYNISIYMQTNGYVVENKRLKLAFSYLWTIFGSLVPIIFLIYCNYHLIETVRESVRKRKLYRVHSRNYNPSSNITITLVGIVCMFIICTLPSEIINLFYYNVDAEHAEAFMFAIVITNVLLTLNYSMNFLLYCFVNSCFRKTMDDILRCRMLGTMKRQFSVSRRHNGSRNVQTHFTYNSSNCNVNDSSMLKCENLLSKADLSPENS